MICYIQNHNTSPAILLQLNTPVIFTENIEMVNVGILWKFRSQP